MFLTENEGREILVELCKAAIDSKLVFGSEGNFSLRLSDGTILLTPSRKSKRFLKPSDMVLVDINGNILKGNGKPTSEFPLHSQVYSGSEEIGAVIHTHPTFATVLASAGAPFSMDYYVSEAVFLKRVDIASYAEPGTKAMAEAVKQYTGTQNGNVLLKNHGVLVWDVDYERAFSRLEILESVSSMIYKQAILGKVSPIPNEQLKQLYKKG